MKAAPRRAGVDPALVVVLAGVSAALHVGKLPPALPVLQETLGLSLVQSGFLLSLVQLGGMLFGLVAGLSGDSLGQRRCMLLGLGTLATASILGGFAGSATLLLAWRGLEGLGFLLAVTPAPSLVRRVVAPGDLDAKLGLWGAYMPLGTALALLAGPWVLPQAGWPGWWWLLAAATLAMAGWVRAVVPADPPRTAAASGWGRRLRRTLSLPGPRLVGLCFGLYAGQWLAVIGFLPTVYAQARMPAAAAGALTALAAGVNIIGNVAAGRLLRRGVPPPRLLRFGYVAMALGAAGAFLPVLDIGPVGRYLAVLMFSMLGGMIPATLFALSVRLAPDPQTVSTTVGWMQQCTGIGQFAGPPIVAWIAKHAGGWQWTWAVAGLCSLVGLALTARLARLVPQR